MAKKKSLWERNDIQFPRLLAEINAMGLTDDQYQTLRESMDLDDVAPATEEEEADPLLKAKHLVDEILERAETEWEKIKSKR